MAFIRVWTLSRISAEASDTMPATCSITPEANTLPKVSMACSSWARPLVSWAAAASSCSLARASWASTCSSSRTFRASIFSWFSWTWMYSLIRPVVEMLDTPSWRSSSGMTLSCKKSLSS